MGTKTRAKTKPKARVKKKAAARTRTLKYFKPNESRRNFIRVDFDPGSKIRVPVAKTGADPFALDALDLSVYGLSFLTGPKDAHHFKVGMETALTFKIFDRPVHVHARIVRLHPGLIAKLCKIAVEFLHIEGDGVWLLSRFVAEKSGLLKPGLVQMTRIRPKKTLPRKARVKAKPRKKTASPRKRASKKAKR